jgi:hypothetical protein
MWHIDGDIQALVMALVEVAHNCTIPSTAMYCSNHFYMESYSWDVLQVLFPQHVSMVAMSKLGSLTWHSHLLVHPNQLPNQHTSIY